MSRNPFNRSEWKEPLMEDVDGFDTTTKTEGEFREKIVDVTSRMREKAGHMADRVSDTVDKTRGQAAEGLDRAASTLRDSIGPTTTRVARTVADGMESTAQYLREVNFDDLKEDVLNTCRKYPAQTLLGALAVGFLMGRAIRR